MKSSSIQRFSWYLMIYFLIQPILDVITGWQMKMLPNFSLTLGVAIRAIMLVLIVGFILKVAHQHDDWLDRYVPWFLGLLLVLVVINLMVNYFNKPAFSWFTEISACFKSLHYLIIILGMYYAFKNLSAQQLRRSVPVFVYWAQMMINVVMIVAVMTNTAFHTYPQGKLGTSGWFNAGNELSAILAIAFPIVLLYALEKSQQQHNYWYFGGVILSVNSITMLGTKSCFYGMILALISAFCLQLLRVFVTHEQKASNIINTVLIAVLLGGVLAIYPHSPVHDNSVIQNRIIRENQQNKKKMLSDKKHKKHMDHYERFLLQNKELSNPLLAKLLSGRTNYYRLNSYEYKKSAVTQKLFGMGYGGNYRKHPRTVEMDWLDFFFQFGIIGFVITILPLVGIIFYLLFEFFRYFFQPKIQTNLLYFVAFGLGIFMSIFSGHVLNAPGVSMYFGWVTAYLLFVLQKPKPQHLASRKNKVMFP